MKIMKLVVSLPRIGAWESGLVLTSALQLIFFLPFVIRMICDMHFAVKSVSTVVKFVEHVPCRHAIL
jgi:hypothetical protein